MRLKNKEHLEKQSTKKSQESEKEFKFPRLDPVWSKRLSEISSKIEPIYHTTIVGKLKKISKRKILK